MRNFQFRRAARANRLKEEITELRKQLETVDQSKLENVTNIIGAIQAKSRALQELGVGFQ